MADDQDSESEPQGRVPGRSDPPRPPRQTRREADEDPPALSQTVSGDITPRQLRVTPGQTAIATVKIRYHGSVVTELGLTLSGEAAAWTRVVPDVINVLPDTDAEATLQFDPPRASNPKAGLVDLVLNVSSRGNESDRTQLRRPIIVDPFDDLGAEAGDSTSLSSSGQALMPISLRNKGNRPGQVSIRANPVGELAISLSSSAVDLDPGAESTVWVTVRPRQGFAFGQPRVFAFTVLVSSDRSPPIAINGRFEQRPRFGRGRMVPVALVLASALTIGGLVVAAAAGWIHWPPGTSDITPSPIGPTVGPTGPTTGPSGPTTGPTGPTKEPTKSPEVTATATDGPPVTDSPTPADPFAGWDDLGGYFSKGASAVTWGPRLVQVFGPDRDEQLVTSEGDGTDFGEWLPFDSSVTTAEKPAAVAWNDGGSSGKNLRVYIVDGQGQMQSNGFDEETGSWYGWNPLTVNGYGFVSGPGAASRGINRIDVFGRAAGDALNSLQWLSSDDDFFEWQTPPDPGSVRYAPTAVAGDAVLTGVDRFDVFAVFSDGTMHYITYSQGWGSWQEVPATTKFTGGPAVTSWRPGQFDVFARVDDANHRLLHSSTSDDGANWTDWEEMTQFEISEPPTATSWGDGRIDLFVIDDSRRMLHRWYENNEWHPQIP